MKKIDLGQTLTILANVGVIGGILFLAFEFRQSQSIALSEMDASIAVLYSDVANEINDHPDLWRRGLAGESLTADEAIVFENLMATRENWSWVAYWNFLRLGDTETATIIIHDFAAFLHPHPGAREVWRSRQKDIERDRTLLLPDGDFHPLWRETIIGDLEMMDELSNGRNRETQ